LRKGSGILVEGSLRLDQWESNGEKRSRLRVIADRIQFLDRAKKSEPGDVPDERPAAREKTAAEQEPPPAEEKTDADNLPF